MFILEHEGRLGRCETASLTDCVMCVCVCLGMKELTGERGNLGLACRH